MRISINRGRQDDHLSLSDCRSGAVAAVAVAAAADYGPQPTGRPRVPQHGARVQHHLQVTSHWPTRVTWPSDHLWLVRSLVTDTKQSPFRWSSRVQAERDQHHHHHQEERGHQHQQQHQQQQQQQEQSAGNGKVNYFLECAFKYCRSVGEICVSVAIWK